MRIRERSIRLAVLMFLFVVISAPVRSQQIVGPLQFDVSAADSESISVTRSGGLLLVSSVELTELPDPDDPTGEDVLELFQSSSPHFLHFPQLLGQPAFEIFATDLGGGELTDVAVHPFGRWAIGNIRDDDFNDINQLVAFSGRRIIQRVDLPDSADGIGLSPDGRFVVVAVEKGEAIQIYSTGGKRVRLKLAATFDRAVIEPFFAGEEGRLANEDIEPESVKFSPDGSIALVSLQEQSSIAVIDMTTLSLVNMVHLPFGFEDSKGNTVGVNPDGLSFSPNGDFVVVANEAEKTAQHVGGISILDMRQGPTNIPEPRTFSIFDLDPSLLDGSGVATSPEPGPNGEFPPEAADVPRVDPNNTITVNRGGNLITALNIERPPKDEKGVNGGSVLFLDMNGVLDGGVPQKLTRIVVGNTTKARPEGLAKSHDGRFIWVAIESDGGTIARFELP